MDCLELKKNKVLFRVFNSVAKQQMVDVYINDELRFSDIGFMEFTRYIELESGSYNVSIYIAGIYEKPLVSQNINLEQQQVYTVSIIDDSNGLSLLVIKDYSQKKPSDKYSVFRVINLSPDNIDLDVIINNDKLFEEIGFMEGSNYVDVNQGGYSIKFVSSKSNKVLINLKTEFNLEKIYTIYIVGNKEKLKAIQSVDGNSYVCK